MDLQTYQRLALNTCVLKDRQFNLEHAAWGFWTEAGELIDVFKKEAIYGKDPDRVNMREEVGDALWYCAVAARELGVDIGSCSIDLAITEDQVTSFNTCEALFQYASHFGDAVVREGEAGRDRKLANAFAGFVGMLRFIAERNGITLEDAADVNIAKLKKRYPEGFTEEAALNRDLAGEREVLGQAGNITSVCPLVAAGQGLSA